MAKRRNAKGIQDSFIDPVTNKEYRRDLIFFKKSFILAPPYWGELPIPNFKGFNWKPLPFLQKSKPTIATVEGIYFFAIKPNICNAPFLNYLIYIGETDNLQRRFGEYLEKIDDPKSPQYQMVTFIADYPNNLEFYFAELPGADEPTRRAREDELLVAFMPPANNRYPALVEKLVKTIYNT